MNLLNYKKIIRCFIIASFPWFGLNAEELAVIVKSSGFVQSKGENSKEWIAVGHYFYNFLNVNIGFHLCSLLWIYIRHVPVNRCNQILYFGFCLNPTFRSGTCCRLSAPCSRFNPFSIKFSFFQLGELPQYTSYLKPRPVRHFGCP